MLKSPVMIKKPSSWKWFRMLSMPTLISSTASAKAFVVPHDVGKWTLVTHIMRPSLMPAIMM